MKNFLNKVIAGVLAVFSVLLSTLIFLFVLDVINNGLLRAGYLQGTGTIQFIKVFAGIPAFFILAIVWVGSGIYIFHHYFNSQNIRVLVQKFLKVSSIQMLIIPAAIALFLILFKISPRNIDLIVVGIAVFLALICHYIQHRIKYIDIKANENNGGQ